MTCRELVEFLADYLEGDLAPGSAAAFERHLGECPASRSYLASYRTAVLLGKGCQEDGSGSELPEELVAAILSAGRSA
ncbi:MAG TPA: zf-HC2 domain-containing protein [Vicinamibacteria bacterium]|nr:zf-HC2 domain-containing protein [Vicinamibacteria bacterium]